MILTHLSARNDDLVRVGVSRARDFKEFGKVEDDGEDRGEGNEPAFDARNVAKRKDDCEEAFECH